MKRYIVSAFIGLLCLGFIIIVALAFGTTTSIHCTRVEPNLVDCVVQKKFLNSLPFGKSQTLYDVRRAGTQSRSDDFNDFTTWFVVLYTPDAVYKFEFSHYASPIKRKSSLPLSCAGVALSSKSATDKAGSTRSAAGFCFSLCWCSSLLSSPMLWGNQKKIYQNKVNE